MFLGASSVEPFYFTPFDRKRLQAAPEAAREALPNGATLIDRVLADDIYIGSRCIASRNQDIGIGLVN